MRLAFWILQRSKVEEYKEGRSLLERCDKLLHSIAEMTATTELQPSPVSVLDSSFYEEESSLSPVMKRSIDFKGGKRKKIFYPYYFIYLEYLFFMENIRTDFDLLDFAFDYDDACSTAIW